ncbi:SAM-dependent methyltransferase, partial [bacterium]|nr:SAM-dependent methyltransferase [bacterium]
MTDLLRFLASEEAFALRREHAAPPGSPPSDPLRLASALRRELPVEHARALAEQIELERRAYAKFADPRALLFERVALEQATSPGIAWFHAATVASAAGDGARVVDLGCGLGGDAMAFVAAGCRVVAVDRD